MLGSVQLAKLRAELLRRACEPVPELFPDLVLPFRFPRFVARHQPGPALRYGAHAVRLVGRRPSAQCHPVKGGAGGIGHQRGPRFGEDFRAPVERQQGAFESQESRHIGRLPGQNGSIRLRRRCVVAPALEIERPRHGRLLGVENGRRDKSQQQQDPQLEHWRYLDDGWERRRK